MKPSPIYSTAAFAHKSTPSNGKHSTKQRGVVLFFTLIALLAMSLAAVALIRSVDTSAMITGNLAYKQTVTASADAGISAAIVQLNAIRLSAIGVDLDLNAAHPLNQTNLNVNPGYYASLDPNENMTGTIWNVPNGSVSVNGVDASGSSISYIIQRMCRIAGVNKLAADCLLGSIPGGGNSANVKNATQNCPGCLSGGQPAQIRVTVRSTGPNNSVSYVQGFIY